MNNVNKIRLKFFILLCVVIVFYSFKAFVLEGEENQLKRKLEVALSKTNLALKTKDYAFFIDSVDPGGQYVKISLENFEKMVNRDHLLDMYCSFFPDLKNDTRLIDIKYNERWAFYIAENFLNSDENYLTISSFVFHKIDDRWFSAGNSYGIGLQRPNSKYFMEGMFVWDNNKDLKFYVENKMQFQFENLLKEFFKRLKENGILPPDN